MPFKPGVSGNPGGRAKGLAAKVRAATKDGDMLVKFMVEVFNGTPEGCTNRDRVDAAKWLGERGWGKAAQPVTGDEDGGPLTVTGRLILVPARKDDEDG